MQPAGDKTRASHFISESDQECRQDHFGAVLPITYSFLIFYTVKVLLSQVHRGQLILTFDLLYKSFYFEEQVLIIGSVHIQENPAPNDKATDMSQCRERIRWKAPAAGVDEPVGALSRSKYPGA